MLESILNHLEMNNTGALLITGKWGSGKSYYLKNVALPYLKEHTGFTPVIVSLYGEETRAGVAKKIIYGFLDSKSGVSDFSFHKVAAWISKAAPYIPKIKEYVDLSKILEGSGENFLKFLPHNKILIVLDDLERKSDSLEMADLFGLVNDIVENFGAKVILVANEEKIKKSKLKFKEKTIEKTLEFTPDLSNVFDSLFLNYRNSILGDFLHLQKDFFVRSLLTQTSEENFNEELKESLSNIRTLKFAIEHFKSVYLILAGDKKELSELEIDQLKNIWVFILSVSAEFKSNNLSLSDKKEIDYQATTSDDFGFELSDLVDISDQPVEKEVNYSKDFKEKYFSRLDERYNFYPEIYDFLIGGYSIDKESFNASLKEKFHIEEAGNGVKESYEVLNTLMREWWKFTGEELIEKLKSLLGFVEKGEFDDPLSYINSGNLLFEYSKFLGLQPELIFEKIRTGMEISISRCQFVARDKTTLEMVGDDFVRKELIELIQIAGDLLDERMDQLEEEEGQSIIDLFNSNFIEFVSEFIDRKNQNGGKYSFRSYLNRISKEDIKSWLTDMSLPEVAQMDHLISSRYSKNSNIYNYLNELEFLEILESLISSMGKDKESIEWHVLQRNVYPKVNIAIRKIKEVKI